VELSSEQNLWKYLAAANTVGISQFRRWEGKNDKPRHRTEFRLKQSTGEPPREMASPCDTGANRPVAS